MEEPIAKRTRRQMREKEERENQRCSWADLDRDLLLIIYHKLGIRDLILGGAPFCCTSWYNASKEPSLWREVDLNGFSSSSSCMKNKVECRKLIEFVVDRSGGSITSVDFSVMADEDDLLYVARRCPRLKHFSLRSRNKQMDEDKIFIAISKLGQLESMSIDGDIYWSRILNMIKSGMNFLHLDCVCKLSAFDHALYWGKMFRLFKNTWKLICQNRDRIHLFDELERSHLELEGLILELKGSIRKLKGSVCELKNIRELKICELEHSVEELQWLIDQHHGVVHEYWDLAYELEGSIREVEILTGEVEGFIHELNGRFGTSNGLSNPHNGGAQTIIRRI